MLCRLHVEPKVSSSEDSGIYSYVMVRFTCIGISSLVPSLPTRLLISMHVKHTIPLVHIPLSSWRSTLGFENSRRYQNFKN